MKKVVLVAAHFVPSNLAGVHRTRLWSYHLEEFGWSPIVVTTHWRHYEESLDWALEKLVPRDLRIIRTAAFGTKPIRVIGDLGFRGILGHYRALTRLIQNERIDFVHVTIPSFFSALLGRLVNERFGVPYGIDYIDPWVHDFPGSDRRFTKAWLSARLAKVLEPWAVKNASLITGITQSYFSGVLDRNPHLRGQAITAAMPYGWSERDIELARTSPVERLVFEKEPGALNIVYAGALLPNGFAVANLFFSAVAHLREIDPDLYGRLRLHFIGTGRGIGGMAGGRIEEMARQNGVADVVREHPARISYISALQHLQNASAITILGSTDLHYSPSKVFQAIQARRPVFAMLHEDSEAARVIADTGGGMVVVLSPAALPTAASVAERFRKFIVQAESFSDRAVNWGAFERFSARNMARQLAGALDGAVTRLRVFHNS